MKSNKSLIEDLSAKNVGLDTQIEKLQNDLQKQINEKGAVENSNSNLRIVICNLQSAREKEKLEFEGEIKNLRMSKNLLLKSKLGLKNELEDSNTRTNIIKQETEKVKKASLKTEKKLQSELSHLQTELVSNFCLMYLIHRFAISFTGQQ